MKKKVFSLMMMLVLAFMGVARAEIVEIGVGGTAVNSYLPTYEFYNYSLTQQIYTADEIGMAGTINSFAFQMSGSSAATRNLAVYMVHTNKTAFSGSTDWVAPTASDLVFQGSVTYTVGDWTTITLSTPFEYNGTDNLCLIVDDNTGSYVSSISKFVFTPGGNCTLRIYSDYTDYDATNPSSYSGTTMDVKNQLQLDITPAGGGATGDQLFALQDGEVVETVVVGTRPNGYWMEPFTFQMRNDGPETNVSIIDFTPQDYFTVVAPELPVLMANGDVIDVQLTTGTSTSTAWQMVAIYGEGRTARVWDITAEPYDPEVPDVWELACEEATTFPFVEIPANAHNTELHNDYNLPFPEIPEGLDAVYKLVFEQDHIVTAYVSAGENGKVALYTEDFYGEGGPMAHNYYQGPTGGGAAAAPFEAQIGEGTSTTGYFPFYTLYNYSIAENLFLAAELEGAGVTTAPMTSLSWYATNTTGYNQQGISIWMANVTDTELTTTSHPVTGMTLVYTGAMTPLVGWNEFVFNEGNFAWDGSSNVLIYVQRNNGAWNSTISWQATGSMPFNCMAYRYQDSGAYDATVANPMYTSTTRPNIIMKSDRGRDVRATVPVTFTKHDSYGDGWNGAKLILGFNDGTPDMEITMEDGYTETQVVNIEEGTHVTLTWSPLQYNSDISFEVSIDGNTIYSVSDPTVGLLFEFDVPGGETPGPEIPEGISYGPIIANAPVEAGVYYLVASSTTPDFEVTIGAELMPCPEVEGFAFNPVPADDEDEVEPASVTLQWMIPEYATGWRLVFGSTYYPDPSHPQTIIYPEEGWATNMTNSYTVHNLWNNTNYFWHVEFNNNGACPEGVSSPIWGFTTHLNVPQNLTVVDETVFNDEQITLNWNAVVDRTYRFYNVYRDGELIGNTQVNNIGATSYTDGPLAYNMNGYNYYVTAVYDEGESAPSNTVNVKVSGYGDVNGHVYEQDGTTGIADATVTMVGQDEFGDAHTYNFTTDAQGYYSGHIYAGSYNGQAAKDGYQTITAPVQGNPIAINYNETTSPIDYMMDENFYGPCAVIAQYYPDSLDPNSPYVKVYWGCGLPGSDIIEDFETGDFSEFDWQVDPSYPWTVTTTNPYEGTYCMKSGGAGVANVVSNMTVTVDIPADGLMSFFGKISCESNWDYGYFYIDGVQKGSYTGAGNWSEKTFDITEGTHTFKWSYTKDGSVNSNDDCFYVDYISFYKQPAPPVAGMTYDFEDHTLQGWTSVDADGDGKGWMVGSDLMSGVAGHNGSADFVFSQSYDNSTGVLYPDNYLVSPQVQLGGVLHFYACAQDASYAAEHFGVAVSTTNTNPSSFTMLQEWTMSAKSLGDGTGKPVKGSRSGREQGNWYEYTVDLSAYSGNGYVAIRHFNCSDMFYLDVDDITIGEAGSKGRFVNDERALSHYRVYRTSCYNDGPYTEDNTVLLATVWVPDTVYIDVNWPEVAPGVYKWGVGAVYVGNRGEEVESPIAWSEPVNVEPDMANRETITIGDGTGTTYYGPFNSLWGYSFVEQIYTAGEIGTAGPITAISFNMQSTSDETNQVDVFMKNVTRNGFADNNDWEPVTSANKVFSGTVTFSPGWTTITLDTPFEYDGTSNLMIGMHEYTPGYSTRYFYYTSVPNALISAHSDTADPDPYNIGAFTGTKYVQNYRTNLQIEINGSGVTPGGDGNYYGPGTDPIQEPRESVIVWSNCLDKDMYLTDVDVNVLLNSADSPEGVLVTLTNLNEYEQGEYPVAPVTLDETGYYAWDSFRKGDYAVKVEFDGYEPIADTVSIWEPTHLRYVMTELFFGVSDVYVSRTGWAMWNGPEGSEPLPGAKDGDRHLEYYKVMCTSIDGVPIFNHNTVYPFCQLSTNEPYNAPLVEGEHYLCKVACMYSTGLGAWSEPVEWVYEPCDHWGPVDEVTVNTTTNGNHIEWVFDHGYNPYEPGTGPVGPGDTFSENFDAGMPAGWTTVDADGDGLTWVSSMTPGIYHNAGVDLTGTGHNSSAHYVISGSYANQTGQVLYPDNYLVSPQVNIATGSTFSFWACAQDASYAAEHFGVAISDNATDWTMVDEWTLTAKSFGMVSVGRDGNNRAQGNWYQKTVDLSSYAGQKYIAIRHFNCSDQFILNVDDIELTAGAKGGLNFAKGGEFYTQYAEDGAMLNFYAIDNVDLRAYLLYTLSNDKRFSLVPEEEYGQFILTSDVMDEFETVYKNAIADFSLMSKVDIANNIDNWKNSVSPTNLVSVLMDVMTSKSRVDNDHCINSLPFCTSEVITFEAANTSNTANEPGMDQGCIYSSYNPSFYHMRIHTGGPFVIHMEGHDPNSGTDRDIDFCMWGPYTEQEILSGSACQNLSSNKIMDCCYSASYSEDCYLGYTEGQHQHNTSHGSINYHMPEVGEYYILMITNYSQQPCVISFTKSEGEGETDCEIVTPTNLIGFLITEDGEYVAFADPDDREYTVEGEFGEHEYCVRPIYPGEMVLPDHNYGWSMGCPVCAENSGQITCEAGAPIHAEELGETDQIKIWWGEETPGPGGCEGDEFTINFDNSQMPSGWTTNDADGDGFNWMLGSACDGVYLSGGNLAGAGHNSSQDLIVSGSYSNVYGPLTPDNWLISPAVTLCEGSTFSFWACGQDASYVAEHFGVAVSDDGVNFGMVQEWTMTAKNSGIMSVGRDGQTRAQGSWHQYTVNLGDYAGEGRYIAIRHFNCTDMFILDVDDIELTAGAKNRDGIVKYNVYRSTEAAGEYTLIGEVAAVAGQTYYEYIDSPAEIGTYYYQVRADYGDCESDPALSAEDPSVDYVSAQMTGMDENSNKVALYPNPTKGNVTIEANGMSRITVVSMLGQVVFDTELNNNVYTLNMSQFTAGMYMVRVYSEAGVTVKRVTVMQ